MSDTSQAPASGQYECWKKYPNSFSEPTHEDWLRELASLRAECDKWKGQIKEWQAANIQLGQRAERAEQELKDWGELFSAAMCAGIPDRTNLPLLIKEIWPNEWHQDCAAVSFLIKEVYGRAERAEAERDAAVKDAERLDKANTELAQESCILRLVLGELVDAVNGTNDLDEMDGEEYRIASQKLEDAIAKAIPHTEEAIQQSFIDAAIAARKGEQ